MSKYRLVPEQKLLRLLEGYARLVALENGGVDNWEWYGESLGNYLDNYFDDEKYHEFSEIAEETIKNYQIYEN